MIRKQELLELNKTKVTKLHSCSIDLDEMELFRTFKKYDRNMNGFLEFSEYS